METIDYILFAVVALWPVAFLVTIRLHWKQVDDRNAKLKRNKEARRDSVMVRLIMENKND